MNMRDFEEMKNMPPALVVNPVKLIQWTKQIREMAAKEISASDYASEQSFDAKVVSIVQDVTDAWFEEFVAHVKNMLIEDQKPLDLSNLKSEIDKLLGG